MSGRKAPTEAALLFTVPRLRSHSISVTFISPGKIVPPGLRLLTLPVRFCLFESNPSPATAIFDGLMPPSCKYRYAGMVSSVVAVSPLDSRGGTTIRVQSRRDLRMRYIADHCSPVSSATLRTSRVRVTRPFQRRSNSAIRAEISRPDMTASRRSSDSKR
jgi:hypothetical protein